MDPAIIDVVSVPWWMPPGVYDILATLILGTFGVWAREIYMHFDQTHPIKTNPSRFMLMMIPGMFSGFFGGEIATLSSMGESGTWLMALVLGYGGTPTLEIIIQAANGTLRQALSKLGVEFETCEQKDKDDAKSIAETAVILAETTTDTAMHLAEDVVKTEEKLEESVTRFEKTLIKEEVLTV